MTDCKGKHIRVGDRVRLKADDEGVIEESIGYVRKVIGYQCLIGDTPGDEDWTWACWARCPDIDLVEKETSQ